MRGKMIGFIVHNAFLPRLCYFMVKHNSWNTLSSKVVRNKERLGVSFPLPRLRHR